MLTFDDGYSSYNDTMEFLKKELISAIFFISTKEKKTLVGYSFKIIIEKQHVENKYNEINYLLSNLGHQFKVEEYIDSNSIQTFSVMGCN